MIIHYIYRHIRQDTGKPFYIGKGCYKSNKNYNCFSRQYKRAFNKSKRSDPWKNIFNTSGREVEILYEDSDESFIYKKEEEFIELYGRADLNEGPLVNLTIGGGGLAGKRNPMYGKSRTKEYKDKLSKKLGIPVLQFDKEGNFLKEWVSISKAVKELDFSGHSSIALCCRNRRNQAFNYVWRFSSDISDLEREGIKIKEFFIGYNPLQNSGQKAVVQYDKKGNIIDTFKSITKAAKSGGYGISYISKVCRGEKQMAYGYNWEFKEN